MVTKTYSLSSGQSVRNGILPLTLETYQVNSHIKSESKKYIIIIIISGFERSCSKK